jgi:hypothetical protein
MARLGKTKKWLEALGGVILAAAVASVLVWKEYLLYNEAVGALLKSGGAIGLLTGATIAMSLSLNGKHTAIAVAIAAGIALIAIYLLNDTIGGEREFAARGFVLLMCALLALAAMSFTATTLTKFVAHSNE